MILLPELQKQFLSAILCDAPLSDQSWVLANGMSPTQRLQIYRNNARIVFEKAMQATYPVLLRLSGEDWFNQTVGNYRRLHPSRSGDLNEVGGAFADFLRDALEGGEFAYFSDVAVLEWTYQQILNEREGPTGNFEPLGALSDEDMAHLRFTVNPTVRTIASNFPLFDIWRSNRADESCAFIDLRRGRSEIFLIRRSDHVEVREIPTPAFALLRAFVDGATVADGVDRVAAAIGEFDLTDALARLIELRALDGFMLTAKGQDHAV